MKYKTILRRNENAAVIVFVLILAFIFSLNAITNLFCSNVDHTDIYVFQYIGRVILNGGMPYRDTFDHKGPLLYVLNALGLFISGKYGMWLIEFILLAVFFFFIYKTARLWVSIPGSILTLIIVSALLYKYFTGGKFQEEFALPFICISLYIYSDYFLNDRISRFRLIICGLSFGAVCLLRPNMAGLWIVMSIGVLISCIKAKEHARILRFLLYFMLGFLLIVLPFSIWLAANGAWKDFIADYLGYNRLYTVVAEEAQPLTNKIRVIIFLIKDPVMIYSFAVLLYAYYRNRTALELCLIFYFVISLVLLSLSGRSFAHYEMIMLPTVIYPLAFTFRAIRNGSRQESMLCDAAAFYFVLIVAAHSWINGLDNAVISFQQRKAVFKGGEYEKVIDLVVDNTAKDDEIVVCGNADIIYNMSDRYSATRYSYQNGVCKLDPERREEFYQTVASKKPPVIIVGAKFFDKKRMKEYLTSENYHEIGSIQDPKMTVYQAAGNELDSYNVSISANDDNRHNTILPISLEKGKKYRLTIDHVTVMEGDAHKVTAMVYDYKNKTKVDQMNFNLTGGGKDLSWDFSVPDAGSNYLLRLYSGKAWHTENIGVDYTGISVREIPG